MKIYSCGCNRVIVNTVEIIRRKRWRMGQSLFRAVEGVKQSKPADKTGAIDRRGFATLVELRYNQSLHQSFATKLPVGGAL
jgi:hypothetical protein